MAAPGFAVRSAWVWVREQGKGRWQGAGFARVHSVFSEEQNEAARMVERPSNRSGLGAAFYLYERLAAPLAQINSVAIFARKKARQFKFFREKPIFGADSIEALIFAFLKR